MLIVEFLDSINFLNTVECYNLSDDKWNYVAPMNIKRSRMGLVTCNSKLYAIGGYVNLYFLCQKIWIYYVNLRMEFVI